MPEVGKGRGESDGSVSPSLVKESDWGVGVGLAVSRVGVGVRGGEVPGAKTTVVAAAGVVGVAVKPVTTGATVGISVGEHATKSITVKHRAGQQRATNC